MNSNRASKLRDGLMKRGIYDDLFGSKNNSSVDLSGSKSLLGSLAKSGYSYTLGTQKDFIPVNDTGGILMMRGQGAEPSFMTLDSKLMQAWAYRYCMPLGAIIDKLAEADTNGIIKFLDRNGNVVKNYRKVQVLSKIKKLFDKPNPYQTWHEFNNEQIVTAKTFGYCPVLAIKPLGMHNIYTKYMFNLNPVNVTPVLNSSFSLIDLYELDYNSDKSLIKEWTYSYMGKSYSFSSEDIILVRDGIVGDFNYGGIIPVSKICGTDYWISNIVAAMEADNVLLKKKGPLGVFSYDPKPDMAGWEPLTPLQKDELQQELGNYGLSLGQLQYIISKVPIKWNSMSFNVRDLMTKETVRQGIDGLCDRFGYPAELMSGKNATYENRSSAEKFLYQSNVIPFSRRRMSIYSIFFELDEYEIILDYDHVASLQEDILRAGEASRYEAEGLEIEWRNGMITWNDWQTSRGRDSVAGMDIYYNEWIKKYGQEIIKTETKQKGNNPAI